jgi:hypothetical protein
MIVVAARYGQLEAAGGTTNKSATPPTISQPVEIAARPMKSGFDFFNQPFQAAWATAANNTSASTARSTTGNSLSYGRAIYKRTPVVVSNYRLVYIATMNLRAQVEELLPDWERWYPSLFDAASDLGLIRAEVCDPDSLLLTRRHAKIRQRAAEAHREKWGG